uniref:Uncharacterized protein n=1 Tax=Rhizophora mucronata TaxID=61149 RepID=A0A2P2QIV6_RHIMU
MTITNDYIIKGKNIDINNLHMINLI